MSCEMCVWQCVFLYISYVLHFHLLLYYKLFYLCTSICNKLTYLLTYLRYDARTATEYQLPMPQTLLILDSIREDVNLHSPTPDADQSPVVDFAVEESPVVLPVAPIATSVRPLTPANRSLRFLETGAPGSPSVPVLSSRAAVPGTWIASTDLLDFIDPLRMDQIALHDHQTARDWPAEDRRQLLAVTHRDLYVARRNVADLTRYLDDQAARLCWAACSDVRALCYLELYVCVPGHIRITT